MSQLYGPSHRRLHDQFGTGRLADRLEDLSHAEFDDADREFISNAPMFFLSTVDTLGRPTVSYKGGAPGFVRITGPSELLFPSYDGNGMFLSVGNIAATANIGMLFIDFENPRRLRLQGVARIAEIDAQSADYPGAQLLISVQIERIFVNCGRYIHRTRERLSAHVPDENGQQPFPIWKRLDLMEGALSDADQQKADAAGGIVPITCYRGEDEPPAL